MIFSVHTDQHIKDAVNIFGYAYGYNRICHHFDNFKYNGEKLDLVQNNPYSKIQMFYMEPEWYNLKTMTSFRDRSFTKFYDHQYKIYGTHLEATRVWSHWIDSMNQVDEIWVGNQFAADAVINSNIKTPVHVFEHGIDDMWKPRMRGKGNKIKFLHVDSGSPRKRADLVEKAFSELFGNNNNVHLTLKYHSHESSIGRSISISNGMCGVLDNVTKIFKTLSQEEMVDLFYDHDILVYPSEGEGFGFIPLQALATGMPVISTGRWCSYEKYFASNIIESTIGPTTYSGYFEGEVVLAEFESLLHLMKKVYEDIDNQCNYFYNQANSVYEEYNWQNRCNYILNDLISRVGVDMFEKLNDYESNTMLIKFCGNGRYITKNGIEFSPENRVEAVDIDIYRTLLTLPQFEKYN